MADLAASGPVPPVRSAGRGSAGTVAASTFATSTVVARLTAKKAARSGALWGYFFGVCVASSALTYLSSYKTAAAREKLAANFGTNTALAALFGPAHELQTVAGFTAYKVLGFLSIVGAVWGLLAATRLFRGEEDAGRWELVLCGQTTRRGAAAQALLGLGSGLVALFMVTALVTVLTGRSSKVHFSIGEISLLCVGTRLQCRRYSSPSGRSPASWPQRVARPRRTLPTSWAPATRCAWWPIRGSASTGSGGLPRSAGWSCSNPSPGRTGCRRPSASWSPRSRLAPCSWPGHAT